MRQALPPWLQRQLASLRQQRSHALLLSGPPGLGQYELALELARVWLCERPSDQGACGACSGCHAIEVRTHPDLFVLLPEVLAIELGWPLDPKTQDKIDKKNSNRASSSASIRCAPRWPLAKSRPHAPPPRWC